jgi:hypothetical protein
VWSALRTHLLNNIESSNLGKASAASEHNGETNIDPAISSLHVISSHLAGNAPVAPVAPVGHLNQNHLADASENTPVLQTYASPASGSHTEMHDASRKKGGKRELSTSKRAAQNRAAQVGVKLTICVIAYRV